MAASLPGEFNTQAFTDGGALASGYRLYTYTAGTTTHKAAYTDSDGSIAHTYASDGSGGQYIALNSRGELPAPLFLTNGAYDISLKTPAGVTKWTRRALPQNDAAEAITASLAATGGAALVGFDPTTAYAAGTVGYYLRGLEVNVFKYIPKAYHAAIIAGTSTIDVSAYVDQAIDAAVAISGPSRVVFPTGKYRMDTALGYYTGNDVTIDFQGSTLDFSNAPTNTLGPLIGFQGTYGATAVLTGNAAADQATLAVNSSGFAVGDFVRVYSSGVWDSTRTSSKLGEISNIETVPSGSSVTLVTNLESAYTTAQSATLQKLTPCRNVRIINGRLIAPTTDNLYVGVDLKLCVGSVVDGMRSLRCDVIHVRLLDCIQSHVRNCDMDESANATQAYGISFTDACQDCTAIGNTMRNLRHAFTTNNTVASSYGITRRCLVANNTIYNNVPNTGGSSGDALDTHAGSDQIAFVSNIVQGAYGHGINAECRKLVAIGNLINGSTAAGIRHAPYADYTSACIITGNTIEKAGDDTDSGDYGIRVVVPNGVLAGQDQCIVQGNRITSKNVGIQLESNATYKIVNFVISGNVVALRPTLTGASTTTIETTYAQHGSITGNRAKATNAGINVDSATHVSVCGNSVEIDGTTGTTGYGIRTSSTCSYISVTGNTAYYSASGITSTVGISFGGTTTYSGAWNNVTQGFGTNVNVGAGTGVASANNI